MIDRQQPEEQVRAAEEPARSLVMDAPVVIFNMSTDGKFTALSLAFERITGWPQEAWVGRSFVDLIHPDDLPVAAKAVEKALHGQVPEPFEMRVRSRSGDYLVAEIHGEPKIKDGRVVGMTGTGVDITQRKRAEEALHARERQQAAVARLGQLALETPDLSMVMNTAVALLAETLSVEYCELLELQLGGNQLLLTAGVGWKEGSVGRMTVSGGKRSQAGYTLLSSGPVIVDDLRSEKRFRAPSLLIEHGAVSGMTVHIPGHNGPYGVLGAHTTRRRSFTEDDIHFLQAIANVLAAAIERERVEHALRDSEGRLTMAMAAGHMGAWEWDVDSGRVEWSATLEAIHGLSPGQFGGTFDGYLQDIHPDDRQRVIEDVQSSLEEGTHETEYRIIRPDGSVRWLSAVGRVLRDGTGSPQRMVGLCADITGRKRAEDIERDLRQRLTLLAEASGNLLNTLDVSELLPAIRDLSARLVAADAYAIWLRDGDEWRVAAMAGLSESYASERLPADDQQPALDRPIVIEDTQGNGNPVTAIRSERYQQEGIRALAILPLEIRRETRGTLVFYYRRPHRFSEVEIEVARALANLAASAIDTAQLYEEQRRLRDLSEEGRSRQAFLSEASAQLAASTTDYSMTLASVARLCVPFLADWSAVHLLDDSGAILPIAIVHEDPDKLALARELQELYRLNPTGSYGLPRVLRTGQPEFYPEITDAFFESAPEEEEQARFARAFGLKSVLVVPLTARGRTLGALSLATAESGRHYTEDDLALAQELGRRAGLAVDNARLYADLQRANEAKDEFLGLISHELRTPITTIYGGARMLRSRGERLDRDSSTSIVADIEEESDRLYRMVENLLALARMDLGQQVTTEPVLIQRVVQKLTAAFAQRRPNRQIRREIEPDLGPVAAQPTYVEQILRNLVMNADKYSPQEEPIEISVRSADGDAEVSVLDRGPGIDAEQAEQIFERFYRSGRANRTAKGAGLGLTVCKRLVELQGGRIWARPREGGGLQVSCTLPLYREET